MISIDNYLDSHYIHRSNWLRAAVLGANDGIISISSLAIGVATAGTAREPVLLATIAGLVAGALSMAAGEYVSVSSQSDIEKSDIERERKELEEMPENELKILSEIYERRGLKKETAIQVAKELTQADALGAYCHPICTRKQDGVFPLRGYNNFSDNTWCSVRKIRGHPYNKTNYPNCYLGDFCNGIIYPCWISL